MLQKADELSLVGEHQLLRADGALPPAIAFIGSAPLGMRWAALNLKDRSAISRASNLHLRAISA